jgi:glycosyltransferase involved in cell wall biosynthesis
VSRALHIGLFTRSLPLHQAGGFERHTEMLALELATRGHAVTEITSRLPARPRPSLLAAGLASPEGPSPAAPGTARIVACRHGLPGRYELGYGTQACDLFARLHARRPFDLVVGAGWGAAALVTSRRWAATRVPAAMIAHGSPRSELATKRRRLGRGPLFWAHALRYRLAYPERRRALHAFDRVIAVSASVGQRLREEFALPAARLAIVPNGVEVEALAAAVAREEAAAGDRGDARTLLVTGRLHAEKGVAVLLQAMTLLAPQRQAPRLLIAGEGPARPALERLAAARLPRGEVTFAGFVAPEALPRLLAQADLYIFPSTCDEGMPLALLEAMAAGLAIVASRVAGVIDAVRDGDEALLVPPGDAPALAGAIATLLADPARARALGRAAQARCRREFDAQRMKRDLTLELTRLVPAREE